MTMLAKLQEAIQQLETRKNEMLDLIQESGWKDDRPRDRIPELREDSWLQQIDTFGDKVIPEQSPLPPHLAGLYQRWYSAVRAILARNQPDRLSEFDHAYAPIVEDGIRRLLEKRYLTRSEQFRLMDLIGAQFDILAAVPEHLRFSVFDIELEAYSVLMDDEIAAARYLLKRGFLRPAGVLAGVTLERHLKNLLRKHSAPIKYRKNSALATLNDLCKANVYDLVTWRKIQHLSDLRNLCAHDKTREPTNEQVTELIDGVSGVLRSQSTSTD